MNLLIINSAIWWEDERGDLIYGNQNIKKFNLFLIKHQSLYPTCVPFNLNHKKNKKRGCVNALYVLVHPLKHSWYIHFCN